MTIDKPTILVYDDAKAELQLIKTIIIEAGYIPLLASTEKEFNRYLYDYKISLIVLDVVLDKGSGFEVCNKLKRNIHTKSIPVIFLTSINNDHDIALGLQLGAEDFINKPLNREIFALRIKSIINRYKKVEEHNALFKQMNSCACVLEPLYDHSGKLMNALVTDANPAFLNDANLEYEDAVGTGLTELDYLNGILTIDELNQLLVDTKPLNAERYNAKFKRWFRLKSYLISYSKIVIILADVTDDKRYELEQTLISSISKSLLSNKGFEANIKNALELLGNYLDVSRVYIYESISSGQFFNNTYEWCAPDAEPYKDYLQHVDFDIIPSWKTLIQQHDEIVSSDISELPNDISSLFEPQGVKAIYASSLVANDEHLGYIGVNYSGDDHHWTSYTLNLIRTVANIISTALQREKVNWQLADSKRELDVIFENTPITQFLVDNQLKVLKVNHSQVFDYKIDIQVGESLQIGQLISCVNQDKLVPCGHAKYCSQCILRNTILKTQQTGEGQNQVEGFMRVKAQQENVHVYVLISTVFIENRHGKQILVSINDISKRKKAEDSVKSNEKRLKQIFTVAQVGICLAKQGDFMFVNKYFAELLGYDDKEIMTIGVSGILDQSNSLLLLRESGLQQIEIQGYARLEITLVKKDGGLVYVMLMSTYYNSVDESDGIISVITDITNKKLAHESLLKNQKSLRKANKDKDTFISILGHDLNNAIGGSVQIVNLLSQIDCSESQRVMFTKQVFDNALSAHGLLTNLVIWGKSSSGKIRFNPELVLVSELFDSTNKLYKIQLEQKRLLFSYKGLDQSTVWADRFMIDAVIRNLVNNAIKYTPEGGEIVMDLTQQQDNTLISVCDTGIGIKPEKASQLFTDAYMQSEMGTEGEQGTGIGLKIIKGFVDVHKGQIHMNSEPGKGTCVSISFPDQP
ncbi:ATP-binding protein [Carboxylicivirga sp. M1479]|uniref:ATP-binding protein n=1 Tax=Carboxylicivirga sp. M1479 TaxID=2594476 RepID=UPI0011788E43|nr:ATP-binding protein [Carboxylicivirga sp. M1479]TRX72503.1 response regulator [Carboxylicivirga sp. M1479]